MSSRLVANAGVVAVLRLVSDIHLSGQLVHRALTAPECGKPLYHRSLYHRPHVRLSMVNRCAGAISEYGKPFRPSVIQAYD